MYSDDWHRLRTGVKHCPFVHCSRHPLNPQASDPLSPILFSREEGSLGAIRCVVVSQEPGASLRKYCAGDVDDMEEKLRDNCRGVGWKGEKRKRVSERGTSPVNTMIRIFGPFDLESGPIYWTHALKCVPVEDPAIASQWNSCAPYCIHHLKSEISALPSDEIAVVSIGRYALAACRHLLFGDDLTPPKITEYIRDHGEPQPVFLPMENQSKVVHFTAFLHPANRNRILSKHDIDGRIEENERRQEEFLKGFVKR